MTVFILSILLLVNIFVFLSTFCMYLFITVSVPNFLLPWICESFFKIESLDILGGWWYGRKLVVLVNARGWLSFLCPWKLLMVANYPTRLLMDRVATVCDTLSFNLNPFQWSPLGQINDVTCKTWQSHLPMHLALASCEGTMLAHIWSILGKCLKPDNRTEALHIMHKQPTLKQYNSS